MQGKIDRWQATLDNFLTKVEDLGLDHAQVRVEIANYYMGLGQWDKAKPYAEDAAATWAEWAMMCAARCAEGEKDWQRAEGWWSRVAERYADNSWAVWYFFCKRTGQGNLTAAREALERYIAQRADRPDQQNEEYSACFYWLDGQIEKAKTAFTRAYQNRTSITAALCLAMIADDEKDASRRNELLKELVTKHKNKALNRWRSAGCFSRPCLLARARTSRLISWPSTALSRASRRTAAAMPSSSSAGFSRTTTMPLGAEELEGSGGVELHAQLVLLPREGRAQAIGGEVMAKVACFAAMMLLSSLRCGAWAVKAQTTVGSAETAKAAQKGPVQPEGNSVAVDSLGDPLPDGARLRLGTVRFRPPSSVVELALSPDEKTIISAGSELIAWDANTGKELWRAASRRQGFFAQSAAYGVRAVAFAPDSAHFYTTGKPGEVVVWETTRGIREVLAVKTLNKKNGPMDQAPRAVDVAPGGQSLALGSAGGVAVCDLRGTTRYEIANSAEGIGELDRTDRLSFGGHFSFGRFSPDGKVLAVVTSDHPDQIRLCEAANGRVCRTLELAARLVRMAFSPDSKRIAATERDNAVRLYNADVGDRVWSHVIKLTNPYENYTSAVAYSPDGKLLAVCATDNLIYLINPASGEPVARAERPSLVSVGGRIHVEQQDAVLFRLGWVHSSVGCGGPETASIASRSAGYGRRRRVT